jgi:MerR family mercuric resistance operon transcriptional regulator
LGFSLGEIRELLAIQDGHADACVEVKDLLQNKLAIVRNKKAELERLEAHLSLALRKCNQALKRKRSSRSEICPVLKQMGG